MKAAVWLGPADTDELPDDGPRLFGFHGEAPYRFALTDIYDPEPGFDEVVVDVRACGVCGSDLYKIIKSTVEPWTVLGHEVTGVVAAAGSGIDSFAPGDRVVAWHHAPCGDCHFCRRGSFSMCRRFKATNFEPGGFAEKILLSTELSAGSLFKLPDAVSFELGTFVEPYACILRALDRVKLLADDLAVVVGAGFIGQLAITALNERLGAVVAVEPLPDRRVLATSRRAAASLEPGPTVTEVIVDLSEGRGADYVFVTHAAESTAAAAFEWVRPGGTICLFAGPTLSPDVGLSADKIYHMDLTVYGSYSPSPAAFADALAAIAGNADAFEDVPYACYGLETASAATKDQAETRVMKAIVCP
ncbi:MAG: alcohol dehydrogenase catalytic domain-containing protein [Candidatus Coatesbacteria bacterium]|nr:MAG: alcohol dehydrogenase catalytic domain-containing protein [Candidatus Coatesbacteria bacterium]